MNKKTNPNKSDTRDLKSSQKSSIQIAQKTKIDSNNELKIPVQEGHTRTTSSNSLVIEDFDYTGNSNNNDNVEGFDKLNKSQQVQVNDSLFSSFQEDDDQDDEDLDENEEYYEHFEQKEKDSLKDDEDDDDEEYGEYHVKDDNLFQNLGSEVRIDLINDIKGEFLENDSNSPFLKKNGIEKKNVASFSELKYSYSKDEDEEEEENEAHDKNTEAMSNLSNLRICIDEIEELVDKSNKTCFVFVIQVWNLQPLLEHAAAKLKNEQNNIEDSNKMSSFNDELPTWSVKRKYDEFYVLDNKLKEFHGGLISSNNEYNINNQNQITVQLPSKQRAVFLIANTKGQIEFLNSVKNDFTKYLQVINVK